MKKALIVISAIIFLTGCMPYRFLACGDNNTCKEGFMFWGWKCSGDKDCPSVESR